MRAVLADESRLVYFRVLFISSSAMDASRIFHLLFLVIAFLTFLKFPEW